MARKHWKKASKDAKPGESCYSAVKWAMLHGTLVFHKLCPLISASSVILRMMWFFLMKCLGWFIFSKPVRKALLNIHTGTLASPKDQLSVSFRHGKDRDLVAVFFLGQFFIGSEWYLRLRLGKD